MTVPSAVSLSQAQRRGKDMKTCNLPVNLFPFVMLQIFFVMAFGCFQVQTLLPTFVEEPTVSARVPDTRFAQAKNLYKRFATQEECRNARSIAFADSAGKAKAHVSTEDAKAFALGGFEKIAQGSGDVNVIGLMSLRLSQIQHSIGLFGTVGEIGVHHGRYTGCLFIGATANEALVVADIFEQQDKNIDGSGNGNKEFFMEGLKSYGLAESTLHTVFTGSSDELPFDWSSTSGFPPFRMFSVDGGHTAGLTFNDLEIAFCNLLRGGIVVLDDFPHPHWMGVTEGLFDFFMIGAEHGNVYPLLHCDGKLFMTNTREHHSMYYDRLMQDSRINKLLLVSTHKFNGKQKFELNEVNYLYCDRGEVPDVGAIREIWASLVDDHRGAA